MPVRRDGGIPRRRGSVQRPGRLAGTRILGLLLLFLGLVVTALTLVSLVLR